MRGGKLRIQTAAFCLFMFISLFYRRRYCFSGATEKAKGGREGGRSCFAFVGNVRPALLFLHLFFFFLSVHETSLSSFFFFSPADPSRSLLFLSSSSFFFFIISSSFFPHPFVLSQHESWWLTATRVVDRSFMDLGRSLLFLMIRLLFPWNCWIVSR